MNCNLTITIMAAGEGKRMNSTIPKVLHKFNGTPMLIRIILEVIKIKPQKIIIITGKYDELIKITIKEYFYENNIRLFDTLIFVQQLNPSGTGDAIKCTLDKYDNNENVLILNGDMPLISFVLLEQIIKINGPTLVVARLDSPHGYGRILYDTNNKFIGIVEEKDCSNEEKNIDIINVGIYFLNSKILKKYIPLIDNNNIQKEYYLTDIVKIMKDDIEIKTYLIEEELKYQISGVNTQQELIDLENIYLDT